jgi:hypothetical protein
LCCLTRGSSAFSLISILLLSSAVLSSTCSSLLKLPSSVFFVWLKGLFIYTTSVSFIFLRFFHIFVQLPFYILCCLLYFISLFYIVRCFTLVFIEVFSKFIYLYLFLLMLFICGVLKFLEYILYLLVNHDRYLLHEFLSNLFHDSSLRDFFLWTSLGSLLKFIIFCCGQELGIHFLHFPLCPLLNCFVLFLRSVISFPLFLPIAPVAAVQLCPWLG